MRDLDIRRDDLLGVQRTGTVRWFKEDKGYGRISADDGEVLFVHFTAVVSDGYRTLTEGPRVSFCWDGRMADHGPYAASDVRTVPDLCGYRCRLRAVAGGASEGSLGGCPALRELSERVRVGVEGRGPIPSIARRSPEVAGSELP